LSDSAQQSYYKTSFGDSKSRTPFLDFPYETLSNSARF
jgi:hypothetical protein